MSHIAEDSFEQYSMGTLEDSQLAPLEEHLLVCHECQDRLKTTDEFVATMRAALHLGDPDQAAMASAVPEETTL
ncbi:hypothetical protein [Paludibaculum fermentans]|uniref:hypothetical protein n=1 Tax=Paludibaculum fermentans TaxID=1473598 RepID=UPI003EC1212A